jgi:hypothetical protein
MVSRGIAPTRADAAFGWALFVVVAACSSSVKTYDSGDSGAGASTPDSRAVSTGAKGGGGAGGNAGGTTGKGGTAVGGHTAGNTSSGGADSSTQGGADSSTQGGADSSTQGGADSSTQGGADGSTRGGADGSAQGGADASTQRGADGSRQGGADGSTQGDSGIVCDSSSFWSALFALAGQYYSTVECSTNADCTFVRVTTCGEVDCGIVIPTSSFSSFKSAGEMYAQSYCPGCSVAIENQGAAVTYACDFPNKGVAVCLDLNGTGTKRCMGSP